MNKNLIVAIDGLKFNYKGDNAAEHVYALIEALFIATNQKVYGYIIIDDATAGLGWRIEYNIHEKEVDVFIDDDYSHFYIGVNDKLLIKWIKERVIL